MDGLKPGRKLSVRVNLQRNLATHAYIINPCSVVNYNARTVIVGGIHPYNDISPLPSNGLLPLSWTVNKTVASFKWNYPVSLSKDRHIFRSREHETRISLSLSCNVSIVPRDKSRFPHPRDAASKNLLDARRRFYRATERSVRRLDEDFRPTRCLLFSTVSRERERKKEKTETVLFIVFFNGSAS